MKHYVGLDVSQEEAHICVIDEDDRVGKQDKLFMIDGCLM